MTTFAYRKTAQYIHGRIKILPGYINWSSYGDKSTFIDVNFLSKMYGHEFYVWSSVGMRTFMTYNNI